ncbi:uncharacterized protein LOC131245720 [Magnolia sinica]|uniref:uncharacterized protein LOC131245720 n=1 Tax=Magnolia sinica TaxID=86752 RepID=UPI00265995A3|nr:uncharacterized protein LOC131245720 [Magnolia sinica]
MFLSSAKGIWDTLHDMFSESQNFSRVFQLIQEIGRFQQNSRSLKDYYSTLRGMWDKLDMYQPLPSKCKEDHVHAHKQRDDTSIMQFLAGLNSDYLHVRDQVVMQDPLPPLTTVYAMCQRAIISTLPSHSVVSPERSAHLAGDQSSLGLRVPFLSSRRISGFGGHGRGHEGDRSRSVVVFVVVDEDVMVPAFVHIAVELITLLIVAGSYMVVLCMPLLLLLPLLLLRQSSTPTAEQSTSGESLIISRVAYDALMWLHIRNIPEPSHAASAQSGTALLASSSPTSWVIDSGASFHMTGKLQFFFFYSSSSPT